MFLTRKAVVLLAFVSLVAVSCGGGQEGAEDAAAASSGESATSTTSEATTTTSEATTTSEVTTTTVASTTTQATLAEEDFERHLADALLTPDDLPDYLAVTFENSLAQHTDSGVIGDLVISPCGDDVPEMESIDARRSYFAFDENVQLDPQPILVIVIPTVRQIEDVGGSGLIAQFEEALLGCIGQEVTPLDGGTPVLMGAVVEIEERSGVSAIGSQGFSTADAITLFNFVFEIDSLDGHLFVAAFGSDDPDDFLPLALPLVESFQDRISACAADTALCSAPL